MSSLRPMGRSQRPKRHTSNRRGKPRQSVLTSSEDEASDVSSADLHQTRRARTNSYKPGEKRTTGSEARMASRRHHRKDDKSNGKHSERSTQTARKSESRESHISRRHRRSRRQEKVNIDGSEGGFVYRVTEVPVDKPTAPSMRSGKRKSKADDYKSLSTPSRLLAIKTLRLGMPQRQNSKREKQKRHTTLDARDAGMDNRERIDIVASTSTEPHRRIKRSTSLRTSSLRSGSRPGLARSQTSVRKKAQISESMKTVPEEATSLPDLKLDHSASVFGHLFGPTRANVPERKVECLTCLSDDVPISRAPKLACGHRMCQSCLKRIFTMSVTDPAHMPPKCCTADCIPLKYVERLFDTKFKIKWNRKYQEYTTKNRLYCPAKGCGTWIQPRDIKASTSGGTTRPRKYGKCPRCKTKVCAACNCKWHSSADCPKDEETMRFAELAKAEGWQRCYNCSATVELKEGCNHMRCRCTAEFCMICGAKWKTCDCPWFNYATVENDRLNHMNVAQVREAAARGAPLLDQPRAYHEEIERRREQERRDEALARRMRGLDIDNRNPQSNRRAANNININNYLDPDQAGVAIFGVGNAEGHFLNEHFVHRATNILTGAYDPIQVRAADRLVGEIRGNQRTDAVFQPPQPPSPARQARGFGRTNTLDEVVTPPPPLPLLTRRNTRSGRQNANTNVDRSLNTDRDRNGSVNGDARQVDTDGRRYSALAGLTRRSTVGRVDEWRRHISGDAGVAPI